MTKATVGCSVNHNEKTIVLTKAYAKKANTPGTKEFRELSKLHKAYPDYDIVMRTARVNTTTQARMRCFGAIITTTFWHTKAER